jgi:hypothetical protein
MSLQHSESFVRESNLCGTTRITGLVLRTLLLPAPIWQACLQALLHQRNSSQFSTTTRKTTAMIVRIRLQAVPARHATTRHVVFQANLLRPRICTATGRMSRAVFRSLPPVAQAWDAVLKAPLRSSRQCSRSQTQPDLLVGFDAGLSRGGSHLRSPKSQAPIKDFST